MHTDVIVICVSPFDSVVEYPRKRVLLLCLESLQFLLCFGKYREGGHPVRVFPFPEIRRRVRFRSRAVPLSSFYGASSTAFSKSNFLGCHSNIEHYPHASDITSSRTRHSSPRLLSRSPKAYVNQTHPTRSSSNEPNPCFPAVREWSADVHMQEGPTKKSLLVMHDDGLRMPVVAVDDERHRTRGLVLLVVTG